MWSAFQPFPKFSLLCYLLTPRIELWACFYIASFNFVSYATDLSVIATLLLKEAYLLKFPLSGPPVSPSFSFYSPFPLCPPPPPLPHPKRSKQKRVLCPWYSIESSQIYCVTIIEIRSTY